MIKMKQKNDKNYNPKIQKALNKLISEEIIAHDQYIGSIVATCKCQADQFAQMFVKIADDEYDDHFKKLVEYAIANDYDVPYKYKDYEKYADPKVFKLLNNLKSGEKTQYYIDKAVEAEKLAVDSYSVIASDAELSYDFTSILWQIYYDEVEHLEKFQILSDALKAGAELVGF